ncbi:myomegalin [Pteropus alecto]|uniref:myomegalin n=1 Tax=Pteropus alecto TaxID=9402 RepID=UPI000D535B09|nr:myomegalin [Pteropus alecto]
MRTRMCHVRRRGEKPGSPGPSLFEPGREVLAGDGVRELRSSACALHRALDEATSLLTVFWHSKAPRALLPVDKVSVPGPQGEAVRRELLELRTKLSRQEGLLQSTAERLQSATQQKESLEQFIFSQLTRTHDVLKKARTNLEVKSLRALPGTPVS